MKKYILIKADTNDADYVMKKSEITDEQLNSIMPIIEEIKKQKGKFETGECGNSAEELYSELNEYYLFRDMCPYSEYGIHTIEDIIILVVAEEIKLF